MLVFSLLSLVIILCIIYTGLALMGLFLIIRGIIIRLVPRMKREMMPSGSGKQSMLNEGTVLNPPGKNSVVIYIMIGVLFCIPMLRLASDAIIREIGKKADEKTVVYHLKNDQYNKAALLLEQGADPNVELYSTTPLTHVCYYGTEQDEQMAALLLSYGANPNLTDSQGELPILRAILYAENETIVQLLLEYGADPNITGSYGSAPLDTAIHKENDAIINLLIEYGAE